MQTGEKVVRGEVDGAIAFIREFKAENSNVLESLGRFEKMIKKTNVNLEGAVHELETNIKAKTSRIVKCEAELEHLIGIQTYAAK